MSMRELERVHGIRKRVPAPRFVPEFAGHTAPARQLDAKHWPHLSTTGLAFFTAREPR
jgi:hypothetical protein